MVLLQNIAYAHPNKDLLFEQINMSVRAKEKIALIGDNGSGKSTLLKIIAGQLRPSAGSMSIGTIPYFVPQHFGQFNEMSVAEALQIDKKLDALTSILHGDVTDINLDILNDDWQIEERSAKALATWGLNDLSPNTLMSSLSGGQKTKVFLAGIDVHEPMLILLDEPGNHLDREGRQQLENLIYDTDATLIIVSHDRSLLNIIPVMYELEKNKLMVYGGNYAFYQSQKEIETTAIQQQLTNAETALRKAREIRRETIERQNKLEARGQKKQENAGLPTIMMNTFRNNAENTSAKLKGAHARKIDSIAEDLGHLREQIIDLKTMKIGFDHSLMHNGKILVTATDLRHQFNDMPLWAEPINLTIASGERIQLDGGNGTGKTTFIRIITGELTPALGSVKLASANILYIDQDYSIIENQLSVFEQAQKFNTGLLHDHEIKISLSRFLFTSESWDKKCSDLSGGEKMRLILCCLNIATKAPDIIILDEPTNNLDIRNLEILTAAISSYAGTLIVVSHDKVFIEQVNITRVIDLDNYAV